MAQCCGARFDELGVGSVQRANLVGSVRRLGRAVHVERVNISPSIELTEMLKR